MAVASDDLRDLTDSDRNLLMLDDDTFASAFDRRPFKIKHNLMGHPLLQLPRLIELARSLATAPLYFRSDHAINQVDDRADSGSQKRTFIGRQLDRPEMPAAEALEEIETAGAWMQLRDIGRDPEYAVLLAELIDEFLVPAQRVAPGISAPRADIFVSSPGAMTPFHLDEEHNFLLQVSGSKSLSIADGFDPRVLDPADLRAYFSGCGELAPYADHLERFSVHIDLLPGEGVHIPPCHPHWVKNGNAASISLGILWFSDVTARRRYLYRLNGWLERTGFTPSMPGTRPVRDQFKALPLTIKRHLRRWLRP